MRKSIISVMSAFLVMLIFILSSCENLLLIDEFQLYQVSFETNGGTQIEPFRSCRIEKVQEIKKNDATFNGWFLSSDFSGEPVSFPYELTEDTTFYAKWTQKYSVNFATNGGSEIVSYKTTVITKAPDTTRDGYYFAGWYENPECGGEQIQFPYYPSESITLYAKWIANTDTLYKVEHYKQNTSLGAVPKV